MQRVERDVMTSMHLSSRLVDSDSEQLSSDSTQPFHIYTIWASFARLISAANGIRIDGSFVDETDAACGATPDSPMRMLRSPRKDSARMFVLGRQESSVPREGQDVDTRRDGGKGRDPLRRQGDATGNSRAEAGQYR